MRCTGGAVVAWQRRSRGAHLRAKADGVGGRGLEEAAWLEGRAHSASCPLQASCPPQAFASQSDFDGLSRRPAPAN